MQHSLSMKLRGWRGRGVTINSYFLWGEKFCFCFLVNVLHQNPKGLGWWTTQWSVVNSISELKQCVPHCACIFLYLEVFTAISVTASVSKVY